MKNNLLTLALFLAIVAAMTVALRVSYTLGHIDGAAEKEANMILASREAAPRKNVELPVIVSYLPYMTEVPQEAAPEDTIETTANESDGYREDVPLSPELQAVLLEACEEANIDLCLALGVIETESGFDPEVVSNCNCYGLMQLNPKYFPEDLSPADNIRVGVAHLADCIARYNDLEAGLTAYNAWYDNGIRWYAEAVLEAAERWREVK